MSANEKFERDFESFLKDDDSTLAALYRKLPRPEPDEKLDSTVRAMAQRAAATALARLRRPRWLPALSAAAVVALAAGIAFRIGPQVWQHNARELQKADTENAVSTRAGPAAEAPPASAPAAPAQEAAPPAAAEVRQRDDLDRMKQKDAGTAAPKPAAPSAAPGIQAGGARPPQPAAAPAAPAAGYSAPLKQEEQSEQQRKMEAAKRAEPAPQAFPQSAERAQELKYAQPGGATETATKPFSRTIAPTPERRVRDEKTQSLSAPATQAASPPPPLRESATPAAPAPPPSEMQSAADKASAESMPAESAPTPPAAQTAPPPAPAEGPTAAGRVSAEPTSEQTEKELQSKAAKLAPSRSTVPNARLYPEHWLENIRTMLREHKRDEALRSLAEFRKMYPDYRLPDDLRDLK
jgi:hypothetical protein